MGESVVGKKIKINFKEIYYPDELLWEDAKHKNFKTLLCLKNQN